MRERSQKVSGEGSHGQVNNCMLLFQILALFPFDDIQISGRSVVGVKFWAESLAEQWSSNSTSWGLIVLSDLICIYPLSRNICARYKSYFAVTKRVIVLNWTLITRICFWATGSITLLLACIWSGRNENRLHVSLKPSINMFNVQKKFYLFVTWIKF